MERALFNIDVRVAPISMYEGELKVGVKQTEQRISLPHTLLAEGDDLGEIVTSLVPTPAESENALAPLIWKQSFDRTATAPDLSVGYTAITPLICMETNQLELLPVERIADTKLDPYDTTLIKQSFDTLGEMVSAVEPTSVARRNTLPILSRLLPDPHSFTVAELYEAYTAITRAEGEPDMDVGNFNRWFQRSNSQPTGEKRYGKGRPYILYKMPPDILSRTIRSKYEG